MTTTKEVKKQATLCGGELTLTVYKATNSITGKFTNIKVSGTCAVCPLRDVCAIQFNNGTPKSRKAPEAVKDIIEPKVMVYAFTGMPIGELSVIADGTDVIEVETKGGNKLVFDKATGIQTNCKNPAFANRLTK